MVCFMRQRQQETRLQLKVRRRRQLQLNCSNVSRSHIVDERTAAAAAAAAAVQVASISTDCVTRLFTLPPIWFATEWVSRYGARHVDTPNRASGALHYAASNGRLGVLTVLLAHGANANRHNALSSTPLHYAAWFQHENVRMTHAHHAASCIAACHRLGCMPPADLDEHCARETGDGRRCVGLRTCVSWLGAVPDCRRAAGPRGGSVARCGGKLRAMGRGKDSDGTRSGGAGERMQPVLNLLMKTNN